MPERDHVLEAHPAACGGGWRLRLFEGNVQVGVRVCETYHQAWRLAMAWQQGQDLTDLPRSPWSGLGRLPHPRD